MLLVRKPRLWPFLGGAMKRIVYGVIQLTIESFLNIRFSRRRDYRISLAPLMVIEN